MQVQYVHSLMAKTPRVQVAEGQDQQEHRLQWGTAAKSRCYRAHNHITPHNHHIQPPHTTTTHNHHIQPPHTTTTYNHHTQPPHTTTTHNHHTQPPHYTLVNAVDDTSASCSGSAPTVHEHMQVKCGTSWHGMQQQIAASVHKGTRS